MTTPLQTAEKVGYQANGAPWGPSLILAAALTGMLAAVLMGHGRAFQPHPYFLVQERSV